MTRDPRGLQCGTLSMPDPLYVLESAEDCGEGRRILRGSVHRCSEHDAGRPAIPHHFQCGGVCDSVTLVFSDG